MKLKDFRKHKANLKDEAEFNYCNEHDVSYEEYKKAQKKETRIEMAIVGFEIALLAFLVCAMGVSSIKNTKPVVTTPVIESTSKALIVEPYRAYDPTENGNRLINETDDVIYDVSDREICNAYDTGNVFNGCYRDDGNSYFIWDEDSSDSAYTQYYSYNPENHSSLDTLYVFDELVSNKLYLNFSRYNLSQDYNFNRWLLGGTVPGTYKTTSYTYTYTFGNQIWFNLNFTDDYNLYSNKTYKGLKFKYDTVVDEYSYKYGVEVYATPSSTSDKEVLLFSNYNNGYNAHIVTTDRLGVRFDGVNYGTGLYLAPYLKDSSLTFNTVNAPTLSGTNVLLRPFCTDEYTSNPHIRVVYEADTSGLDLWSNFGDLFLIFWTSITPILTIKVLPMVTIGGLIIAPLILGFVALLLALVKK